MWIPLGIAALWFSEQAVNQQLTMHYDSVAAAYEAGQDIDLVLENNTPSTYSNMPTQQERDSMTQRAHDIGLAIAEADRRAEAGERGPAIGIREQLEAITAQNAQPTTIAGQHAQLNEDLRRAWDALYAIQGQRTEPPQIITDARGAEQLRAGLGRYEQEINELRAAEGAFWNQQPRTTGTPIRAFTGVDFTPAREWTRNYPTLETPPYPVPTPPTNTGPQTEQEMARNTRIQDEEPIVVHTVARKDQTEDIARTVDIDEWLRFLNANNAKKVPAGTSEPMVETRERHQQTPIELVQDPVTGQLRRAQLTIDPVEIDFDEPAFATEARPMQARMLWNGDGQPPF